MKLRMILAIGMLTSVLAANEARADTCTLTVNQSTYAFIWRGQFFSYGIDITPGPQAGPIYGGPSVPQVTVMFVGTNISPGAEIYPGLFAHGHSDLTGYQNPQSGGYAGYYQRQALIFNDIGFIVCATNTVVVQLQ